MVGRGGGWGRLFERGEYFRYFPSKGGDYSKEYGILQHVLTSVIRSVSKCYKRFKACKCTCEETYELNEKLFVILIGNTFVILESKFLDLSLTMRYPYLE